MKRTHSIRAFTLIEVVLALGIFALISGAVYSISSAALDASRATLDEQLTIRRIESFQRVTRDAFLNLPRDGRVFLRITRSASGAPVPEIVFEEAYGVFGVPTLAGGSMVLAARPRADGSRTMSILRIPKNLQGQDLSRYLQEGPWIPLLPRVEKVKWTFFAGGEWREEWTAQNGRPLAVRLQMDCLDIPGNRVDSQFWIPPLAAVLPATPEGSPSPSPGPTPSPGPGPSPVR